MLPCANRRSTRGFVGIANALCCDVDRFADFRFGLRFAGFRPDLFLDLVGAFAVLRDLDDLPTRFLTTTNTPSEFRNPD